MIAFIVELNLILVFGLLACGVFAGLIGALVGIGGGLIIVPTLVLGFDIDITTAVACSLVAVVASSTAAGSVNVRRGLTNMRLGMVLEVATTLGGVAGVYVALIISPTLVALLFSVLMMITCYLVTKTKDPGITAAPSEAVGFDPKNGTLVGSLSGSYFDPYSNSVVSYQVKNLSIGGAVSFLAGILSGLLGVGGGFLKVPAMTLGMKVPMKVAVATSNFTIGVTAVSSLFVYFSRGLVAPSIAAPVAVGVVGGAFFGTSLIQKISPARVRNIFALILFFASIQMTLKAYGDSIGK